jgi:hypothetical protein
MIKSKSRRRAKSISSRRKNVRNKTITNHCLWHSKATEKEWFSFSVYDDVYLHSSFSDHFVTLHLSSSSQCAVSKMHRLMRKILAERATKSYEILHFDIIIFKKSSDFDETSCTAYFIDEFTSFNWIFSLIDHKKKTLMSMFKSLINRCDKTDLSMISRIMIKKIRSEQKTSVAAGLGFEHVEQPDPIQSSGWTRISVQLSGLDKIFCPNPRNLYATGSVSSGSGCSTRGLGWRICSTRGSGLKFCPKLNPTARLQETSIDLQLENWISDQNIEWNWSAKNTSEQNDKSERFEALLTEKARCIKEFFKLFEDLYPECYLVLN